MSSRSDQFRKYLHAEEPLRDVYTAMLSDNSARKAEVSIGVTDRRLLCIADDGTFVNVGYDSICTIRSHPRTRLTCRGNDYRLLLGTGALLAVLGFVGVVALATSALVPLLSLTAVGGLATSAYLWRGGDVPELLSLDAIDERTAADFDGVDALRRLRDRTDAYADARQLRLLGSTLVALCSLFAAVALAASPFVSLLVLPMVGGLALVDYASRHRDEFGDLEVVRRHEREVRISTTDGRAVQFESDPSEAIGRELSRLVFADEPEPARVLSTRS